MSQPATDTTLDLLRRVLIGRRLPAVLDTARAELRQPEFGWDPFLRRGEIEGVLPLLYDTLRNETWLPQTVRNTLQEAYFATGMFNALALHELATVIEHLRAAGIPVIVLKGAVLAETLYANIALRPMVDLDILVPHESLHTTFAVLDKLGFHHDLSPEDFAATLRYESQLGVRKPAPTPLLLEPHWNLIDSPHYQNTLPMSWFWQTARPWQVGQTPCLRLGAEAQVLHLAFHFHLHHQGGTLLWWHDIATLLEQEGRTLDWDALFARAQHFDLVLPLRTTLMQTIQDWQVELQSQVLTGLAALQPSAVEQRVHAMFTEARDSVAQRFWADLATMPGLASKVHYAWRGLFPSAAYMRKRYSLATDALLPAAYLYRLWLGAVDLTRRLFRRTP